MLGQLSSNRSSGQAGASVALTSLSVVEHHSPRARAEVFLTLVLAYTEVQVFSGVYYEPRKLRSNAWTHLPYLSVLVLCALENWTIKAVISENYL